MSSLGPHERELAIRQCRQCWSSSSLPGYDYTREIVLTAQHVLGDTVFVRKGNEVVAFAICHSVPLVEGRVTEEMRVLKNGARRRGGFRSPGDAALRPCARQSRRGGWRSGCRASTATFIGG